MLLGVGGGGGGGGGGGEPCSPSLTKISQQPASYLYRPLLSSSSLSSSISPPSVLTTRASFSSYSRSVPVGKTTCRLPTSSLPAIPWTTSISTLSKKRHLSVLTAVSTKQPSGKTKKYLLRLLPPYRDDTGHHRHHSSFRIIPTLRTILAVSMYLSLGVPIFVRAEGWDPLDACYFLIVTLTSVGYGSMEPVTIAGKLSTIGFILLGFFLVTKLVSESIQIALSTQKDILIQTLQDVYKEKENTTIQLRRLLTQKMEMQQNLGIRRTLGMVVAILASSILWGKFIGNLSPVDSVYFMMITMTTVGFSDLVYNKAMSVIAKLSSILFVGCSVFMFGAVVSSAFDTWSSVIQTRALLRTLQAEEQEEEEEKEQSERQEEELSNHVLDRVDLQRLLRDVDVDGDNRIDMAEYVFMRLKELDLLKFGADLSVLMVLKEEFNKSDLNKDGVLGSDDC